MNNDAFPTLKLEASMPDSFRNYLVQGQLLARNAGLNWNIELDVHGVAIKGASWDLRKLLKDGNPKTSKLRTFSNHTNALRVMVAEGYLPSDASIELQPVSLHWQDLIKAYVLKNLLVTGIGLTHVLATVTMLRLVATVTKDKSPWQLDADDIRLCMAVSKISQPSGQIAVLIGAFVKTVIDAYHLSVSCPLFSLIASDRAAGPTKFRAANFAKKEDALRDRLPDRKTEEKLPELRAFWELMRIVFTEKPRTFMDAIRFAQGRIMAITGLRIGEVAFLPLDWKRTIDYRDRDGTPAGAHGGFSSALLLRHFAEKQGSSRRAVGSLYETSQFVPRMFEEILVQTLEEVERWTAPMRKTLKAQCESGRYFPMYGADELIPIEDFYQHTTGMVLFKDLDDTICKPYFEQYWETLDIQLLNDLDRLQRRRSSPFRSAFSVFSGRIKKKGLTFFNTKGVPCNQPGLYNKFIRVDEAEKFLRINTPTKMSDTATFKLENGVQIQPWEFLFLIPKRAVGEGRDQMPCHVGLNLGIGITTSETLGNALASGATSSSSLFETYGLTDADRALSFRSHSLRHLQNTELFRLGVADTIITKRFNRRSIAQSYEYDHRSLEEELEQITLPDEWEAYLGPKAGAVAKMIEVGRANGPIVKEFKRLRADESDESAYSFLKAEADGFHATPYGHCLNSFTVDPCPTHLECFNGCGHLSATNLPENREHLLRLHGKLKDAHEAAIAKQANSIGRDNQIKHAEVRLAGVARLLETPAGERVFPDGPDLSKSIKPASVLHGT